MSRRLILFILIATIIVGILTLSAYLIAQERGAGRNQPNARKISLNARKLTTAKR